MPDAQIELAAPAATKFAVAAIAARARSAASPGTASTAPSPPKTNGKLDAPECVADGPHDCRARHVDVLVAAGAERCGRLHHIGGADLPVVGKGREDGRIADLLESVEDRQILVAETDARHLRQPTCAASSSWNPKSSCGWPDAFERDACPSSARALAPSPPPRGSRAPASRSILVSFSMRATSITVGPMAEKASRSGTPILPYITVPTFSPMP